jgi:FkbM family methyltransferase
MDGEFFQISLPLKEKIEFLAKKYLTIAIQHTPFLYKPTNSIEIFGHNYHFDDKYGLAILQTTYIDNAFLKNFIGKNSVIVDVGANIGQFNFFCKKYLKSKRVYSFEPIKKTFEVLSKNFSKNIYKNAVSTSKSITFYTYALSVWSSVFDTGPSHGSETIQGIKPGNIKEISSEKIIDLFKIDAEGSEGDVIKASLPILKKSKYILIEAGVLRQSDVYIPQLLTLLQESVPNIKLVRIGRVYNNDDHTTGCVDLLFSTLNKASKKK